MSAFGQKLRYVEGGAYLHWCPGCNRAHVIYVDTPHPSSKAIWSFNHDPVSPAFSPSINIVGVCHYFIRNGYMGAKATSLIEFCGDSKHHLQGQTVELPDFPHHDWDV